MLSSSPDGGLSYLFDHEQNDNNVNIKKCYSRDKTVQGYGRCLIHFCKCSGYYIMNGRLGNVNNTWDFTCYKENGASVVDYLIC